MQGELLTHFTDLSKDNIENNTLCPNHLAQKVEGADYGKVEHFEYYSNTTSCKRGANVLFPPSFDENRKYPVLFFLHGIFGDEYSMINDENTHISEILANMSKEGIAKEVIVIFPHMYASEDPDLKPGFDAKLVLPYDNFINDLVNDLIPYVEKTYPVKTDRLNRGLIGFSMGGRESLFIGLMRSDLFAYIGAIAPAPGIVPAKDFKMVHEGQITEDEFVIKCEDKPELLLVLCGTKDSVVGKFPLSYHEIMLKNNVDHIWYEVPEADHDSNAIRSGLYNFMYRWK